MICIAASLNMYTSATVCRAGPSLSPLCRDRNLRFGDVLAICALLAQIAAQGFWWYPGASSNQNVLALVPKVCKIGPALGYLEPQGYRMTSYFLCQAPLMSGSKKYIHPRALWSTRKYQGPQLGSLLFGSSGGAPPGFLRHRVPT